MYNYETLPIENYYKICEGDVSKICKYFFLFPTKKMIKRCQEINDRFNKELNNTQYSEAIAMRYRILKLRKKKQKATNLLYLLAIREDDDVIKAMNKIFKYNKEKREQSLFQIRGEIQNLSNLITELEAKTMEYEKENVSIYDTCSYLTKYMSTNIDTNVVLPQFVAHLKMIKCQAIK